MSKRENGRDQVVINAGDVKPGETPMVYITRHGVVINDEHGATLHGNDGSVRTIRADGSNEIRNPVIRRLTIDNALELAEYSAVRVFGATSHVMKFDSGATFAYLRDEQGKVVEMTMANGTHTVCDKDGNMRVFGRKPDADPPESVPALAKPVARAVKRLVRWVFARPLAALQRWVILQAIERAKAEASARGGGVGGPSAQSTVAPGASTHKPPNNRQEPPMAGGATHA